MGDLSLLPNSVEDDNLNYPIYMISWNQARYSGMLTEMERGAGRLPEGYDTLSIEAQWEYVVGGWNDWSILPEMLRIWRGWMGMCILEHKETECLGILR